MASRIEPVVLTIAGRSIRFRGDPNDDYFKGLPAFHAGAGRFEHYVRGNLRRNSICLDVGANIGLTAILMALYCTDGRVYALEASPTNARFLRENVSLNGIANCTVIETAVGRHEGSVEFRESVFGAGSHVVGGRQAGTATDPRVVVVPVTTLDRIAESPPLEGAKVDFIKLDVEGYEPAVLAGAARLCERDRPGIFMEFNSWCLQVLQDYNHVAFARALAHAFDFFTVNGSGALKPLGPGEIYGFLHRNMFQHGCIDDVLVRLRPGVAMPSFAEMTKSSDDLRNFEELSRLRRELAALRAHAPPAGAPPA
jgi:FkbM family methyltransferase